MNNGPMNQNDQSLAGKLAHFTQSFITELHFTEIEKTDFQLTNDPKNKRNDKQIVGKLYQSIKQNTPEADHRYWLVRCWTLLCWQPLYINVISIYGLQHLPNLTHIQQRQSGHTVNGIVISDITEGVFQVGSTQELVRQAALTLQNTVEYYRQLMDQLFRCRPRFSQALLSDAILTALIELQKHSPTPLSNEFIIQQGHLWLDALNLPQPNKGLFSLSECSEQVEFTRKSCCFVYKTKEGKLCNNCPRQAT